MILQCSRGTVDQLSLLIASLWRMKYKQTHKTNNQGILNSVLHTLELTTLTFQTKILLERESEFHLEFQFLLVLQ